YTAEQAKALGLVDEIGYMDDAVAAARKAAGVAQARVVMYHRPKEYRSNYYSTAPAPTPGVDTTLQQLTALVSGSGARLRYLGSSLAPDPPPTSPSAAGRRACRQPRRP